MGNCLDEWKQHSSPFHWYFNRKFILETICQFICSKFKDQKNDEENKFPKNHRITEQQKKTHIHTHRLHNAALIHKINCNVTL